VAGKHILDGLIKWSTRGIWADRFDDVLADHVFPACDEAGLEMDEIVAMMGEELFMSTVWACAFEDFLTREFDDGENAIDDYLKRRGWKETASVRTYLAALRHSTMSLYEVSDIVPGASFRARDMLRGGEPVLISERSATRSLRLWDRIAARVVPVGGKMQIGGGMLVFDGDKADDFLEVWHAQEKLSPEERLRLAMETLGDDLDDEQIAALSSHDMAHASGSLFTAIWLVDVIERLQEPEIPDLRNADGDELIHCVARYPLSKGTKTDEIRTLLQAHDEFSMTGETSWNWIAMRKPAAVHAGEQPEPTLQLETRSEGGALVRGVVRLEKRTLVFAVNSRERYDRGNALLSALLGPRLGKPSIETETVEQIMAARDGAEIEPVDLSDEEMHALVHDQMDRHYRGVLDEPVGTLGGLTPRAAVKTRDGRVKVVEWLKLLENRTAKAGDGNDALASYSFSWMWEELGLNELRR